MTSNAEINAAPAAPTPEKKRRRVGTLTLGAAMIAVGIAIIMAVVTPNFDFSKLFLFAPVVLILLGIELIVSYFLFPKEEIRFDFLSSFICFLICGAAIVLSFVPVFTKYYPQAEQRQAEINREADSAVYDKIKDIDGISSYNTYWSANNVYYTEPTIKDGHVNVSVHLFSDFAGENFTPKCEEILTALTSSGLDFGNISFYVSDEDGGYYSLELRDKVQFSLPAERLEDIAYSHPAEDVAPARPTDYDNADSDEFTEYTAVSAEPEETVPPEE